MIYQSYVYAKVAIYLTASEGVPVLSVGEHAPGPRYCPVATTWDNLATGAIHL